MTNGLKKELAVLTGLLALATLKPRSPLRTGFLSLAAVGLYLSSKNQGYELRGKSVYITGGSRGLGLSLAWNLLEHGAQVTLAARNSEELKRAQEILLKDYPRGRVFTSVVDITDRDQLTKSFDQAIEDMNGIDLLINNAGSILVGPFTSMEKEDFEAQMKLHLYAVIEATQLIYPHFKTRGGGRILNISSMGGKVAVPHMLPYDASKFALAGFSQGVAAELASDQILVTTAYPTVMRTGSAIQAVFKGDHEKEFGWFETVDNLPGISMSAHTAAQKILQAVIDGQTEVILSLPAKARLIAGVFFPETMHAIMRGIARLLPKGDSTLRKTGADSSGWFDRSLLTDPLKKTVIQSEATYNQAPQHDADFNLGLH